MYAEVAAGVRCSSAVHRYLQSARDAIDGAVGRLSAEVISRKSDGRWSIAEILEHLTLAYTGNAAALKKALESGELRARKPLLRQTLGRILVVDIGYFPRVEAPSGTRPSGTIAPERALPAARDALEELDRALALVGQRFGETLPVANHPYFAGLSVQQWRKFHWQHTRHHMKQVESRSR